MNTDKKISFAQYLALKSDLSDAFVQGRELIVGTPALYPEEAASACIFHEASIYMPRSGDDTLVIKHED